MPNQPLPTPTPPPAMPGKSAQVFPDPQTASKLAAIPPANQSASSQPSPAPMAKPNNPPVGVPAPAAAPTPAALPTAPVGTPAPVGTTASIAGLPKPTTPSTPPVMPSRPGTLPPLPSKPPGLPTVGGQPPVTPPGGAPPSGGSPSAAGAATPAFANIKKSPFRFLPFIVGGLVVLGVIGLAISWFMNRSSSSSATPSASPSTQGNRTVVPAKQTTITYWGLWEPSDVLATVLKDFETANPGVKVEYVKQSHQDYRERVQTAIASGNGPDVFRFHASWVPMMKSDLAPMPSSVMTTTQFNQTFYPVAAAQLQSGNNIVGVPLMYDGLALYYNKDVLRTAGAEPPTTWAALRTLATQLTIKSGEKIQRGGLAIGTAGNVEHFSDILGLLMLQNGADLTAPTSPQARDALTFYTNFAKVDKVWDETLPNSTVAFARGDAAMMFAPSWRAHEIKALNPNLAFGIAPLPKLVENKITWASYWAEGVNAQGKNKDTAWKLLQYLSSKDVMKKMYSAQSQVRTFGEPYSRVDLANELASDQYVAPFLTDAPAAKSWYLNSATHDNGVNDNIIKYYEDAVNAVLTGKAPAEALTTVDQGTKQVLRQYGITTGTSTTGATGSTTPTTGSTP